MLKKILKAAMLTVCTAAMIGILSTDAEAKPKNLSKEVKVGDKVYFGTYEQDGKENNGKEKLIWQVLDKNGDKILIMTEKIIDVQPYHVSDGIYEAITWEKSDIRKWLNEDFMNAAFSSSEKNKIQSTKVVNKDGKYGTDGGKDTNDRVCLLSIDEAQKYFKSDDDRKAKVTEYYKQKLRWDLIDKMGYSDKITDHKISIIEKLMDNYDSYWLRSRGFSWSGAAAVYDDGSVSEFVHRVYDDYFGVCPALWVKL